MASDPPTAETLPEACCDTLSIEVSVVLSSGLMRSVSPPVDELAECILLVKNPVLISSSTILSGSTPLGIVWLFGLSFRHAINFSLVSSASPISHLTMATYSVVSISTSPIPRLLSTRTFLTTPFSRSSAISRSTLDGGVKMALIWPRVTIGGKNLLIAKGMAWSEDWCSSGEIGVNM